MFEFWRNVQHHKDLFLGGPCLFQQDSARPFSSRLKLVLLHEHRAYLLYWSASSPDLPAVEGFITP